MEKNFPNSIRWTRPTGRYTIWVRIPKRLNKEQLQDLISRYSVIVSPGSYYFPGNKSSEYFRISIAKTDEKEITEAISRLENALHNLS